MDFGIGTIVFICTLSFIAGFIDSIAGGGGLISLPAYLSAGFPAHLAIGTNKLSSTAGTFAALLRFIKSGKIDWPAALSAVCGALPGSFLGARLTVIVSEIYLKYLLIIILPIIAFFVIKNKGFGKLENTVGHSKLAIMLISFLIGLALGVYDGFFGPGTGSFLILAFTGLIGYNLATASGNTKVVNLASNAGALVSFILMGKVVYAVGIPAAVTGILGNWLGSGLAIKNGAKIIRPVFITVIALLFVKIIYDML